MLEYFLKLIKLKILNPHQKRDKSSFYSSFDHSNLIGIMALNLIDKYKFSLSKAKVLKLILYRDITEIGLTEIFNESEEIINVENTDNESIKESEEIKPDFENIYKDKNILKIYKEYKEQITPESKFVKAIDKLETVICEIYRGAEFFNDPDFIATYADRVVINFPELKTFLKIIKKRMKRDYIEVGFEWKKEYDEV